MALKYPPGTNLKVIADTIKFEPDNGIPYYKKIGDIVTIREDDKWDDAYEFEGCRTVGWDPGFVEDLNLFKPVKVKITDWREVLE